MGSNFALCQGGNATSTCRRSTWLSLGLANCNEQGKRTVGDIFRETFLGFVRVHLLFHASRDRIFGVEMIEELKRHGYNLSPGTLYPILHGMEKARYLRSEQEVVSGKTRKYYRITPTGSKALAKLQERIRELTSEVLDEREPLREERKSIVRARGR